LCIPKTIDNDIMYLDKSFGFETAFAEAVRAVKCAYTESTGAARRDRFRETDGP